MAFDSEYILPRHGKKSIGFFHLGRFASFLLLSLCVISIAGCAYRFTNKHIVTPEGIKTIAVEAIYDTGREVIRHELLWGKQSNSNVTAVMDAVSFGTEDLSEDDKNESERYKIDEEFMQKDENESGKKLLFKGLRFYLSTEVPRYSLEFVILAMGGEVTM